MRFARSVALFLLLLSTTLLAEFVNAAEDDLVVDASQSLPSLTNGEMRLVRINHRPEETVKQAVLRLERQLTKYLQRIDVEFDLTEEQIQKLKLAGKRDILQLVQQQKHVTDVNDKLRHLEYRLAVMEFRLKSPLAASDTDFITEDSLIIKVLMTQLTPEQARRMDARKAKKAAAPTLQVIGLELPPR